MNISASLPNALSSATIVSLFLMLTAGVSAEELHHKRAQAKDIPLSVMAPITWEVFTESESDPNEVLFLQTPEDAEYEVTVSFATHNIGGTWDDVVKRQNYHLIVFEGSPILVNEELKLRGAKGHKWVYKAKDSEGKQKLFYRLYLLLPPTVSSGKRLLVMQGVAPESRTPEAVPMLNTMARSLAWGLATSTD